MTVPERLDRETIETVIAISRRASAAIMAVYRRDFAVECKADDSPLTEADLASHRCIVDALAVLTPDVPVLSEESADNVPLHVRHAWSRFWMVDPLDGTREFVKRNGEFAICIALIEHGIATWGLVAAPVSGVIWHGGHRYGAFRCDASGERRISAKRPATFPLRVAASRSHLTSRTDAMLQRIGKTEQVRLGSALKFGLIAEGGMDVYPRFGPTSEWDTAAGQAVVEGAGGVVLAPDGRPFRYNQRTTLLNGDFIALGDPALPWRDWL